MSKPPKKPKATAAKTTGKKRLQTEKSKIQKPQSRKDLPLEIGDLQLRLDEATETLNAIRAGEVDALVVSGPKGEQLYTLKGAEQPYRILVESMNEGALSIMGSGVIMNCNKAFAKMAGMSCGLLIGRSFKELVSERDVDKYDVFWKEASDCEARVELELSFVSRTVPVLISGSARIIEGESWVFLVVTDISERRRSEAELDKYRHHLEHLVEEKTRELHRSNEKLQAVNEELQSTNEELITTNEELVSRTADFEAVFGNMSDAVIYSDYSLKILMCNPAAEKLFGYNHNELVNIGIEHLYANKNDYERIGIEKYALLNGKELKLPPIKYKRKDGTDFLGEAIASRVITPRGVKGFIGIYRDITERSRIEKELIGLNKALRALSDSSQAIVRAENEQTYLSNVCKIIIEDWGYSMVWVGYAENDKEKSVRPAACAGFEEGYLETLKISWADTERDRGPTGTAIRTGKVTVCRNALTDPAFTPWREEALKRGYASSIVFPLCADSRVFGAVTIYSKEADPFSDNEIKLLTELTDNLAYGIQVLRIKVAQKETEAELMKLTDNLASRNMELETLNKELDSFVYSVSHDLRAPLRIMEGFAKVISKDYVDSLNEEVKDYLRRICSSAERMSRLIEDLLRLSRISRQNLNRMDFALSGIASSIVSGLREADPARNVDVLIEEGMRANVDPELMKIALLNLFANAWKFTLKTEKANIHFGVTKQNGETVYFVKDNGAGFDQTYVDKIFLPFQRLHSENEFEGLGIGLSIAERIIRRHGGRIWAEGAVGKGATLYFTVG